METTIIKFIIPLPPRTKKNSQQIIWNKSLKRPMVIQSTEYNKYERECKKYMPQIETIDYPVNVKCVFYMPTHRRVDISNLFSAISDILVKYKVLADDNRDIIVGYDGSRVLYDKENSRTEITISDIENYEVWKK